jgi:HK97 gp10 family phage protein
MAQDGIDIQVDTGIFRRLGLAFEHLKAGIDAPTMEMKKKIAEVILKRAKQLVPVQTGALRASGRIAKTPSRKGIEVRFGNSRVGYASVVEFGRVGYAPFAPRLYLTKAVRYAESQSKKIIGKEMKLLVRRKLPKKIL